MRYRLPLRLLIIWMLVAGSLVPATSAAAQADPNRGRPDRVVLTPTAGAGTSSASMGNYVSPPNAAPHPFTHLLLRWQASIPDGAEFALQVRASVDGTSWTQWLTVEENDDLWLPADGTDTKWSQTLAVGALARYWQVQTIASPAPNGARPTLKTIDVNSVDASGPLPTPEPARAAGASLASVSKPSVVSRVGWGSPDGEGSRVKPYYYPVNHMVVHHTADSNTLMGNEQSWADRVRAEWSFHTYSRGWGDVGYNYLIDPNGVIYEGRAGGDDSVAFHDTANFGSMGVVLIGTYSAVPPTQAAQDALVRLLAWKSDQKNIDPLGKSYYYGCDISSYCRPYNPGAVVLNIAGHRQVTPTHTTCPGDQTIAYLPGIRERVKRMINDESTVSGDPLVDDLTNGFQRSPSTWHEAACGYDSHTYWTYATDGASENSATWRPTLPVAGRYRVFVHVPQGCGLGNAPYASTSAAYRIHSAEGDTTRTVDQNTSTTWVDIGAYQFNAGTDGAVELYDTTGEPIMSARILFFDAVKWVPDTSTTSVQLTNVVYDRTRLASGELVKVTFTVRNSGTTTLRGQDPRVDLTAGGGLNDLNNGYVYDQDECFAGNSVGSYPVFPKEDDRFRIVLGWYGWDTRALNSCTGPTSDYPWRWGLNSDLAPGQEQTIVGYVRFRDAGSYTLRAGVVQENVQYFAQAVAPTNITVVGEQIAPVVARYDASLQPQAQVYQLGNIPDNFLARTRNPLSIVRGAYVGSFAWNGSWIDWGESGPFGLNDGFLIEQTRSFYAPSSGTYTFRTSSDDGSWLWVDGTAVVVNNGLHADTSVESTIWLEAGVHVLAFKYFERSGDASTGYDVQLPGASEFSVLPDALGGNAVRFGATFTDNPHIYLAADDMGGRGVDHIHWSWDGTTWQDTAGDLIDTGRLVNGSYTLRYRAVDAAGNTSTQQSLSFTVDTNLTISKVYAPIAGR